jgi:hypothetical protein
MIDLRWVFQRRQPGAEPDDSAPHLHYERRLAWCGPEGLLRGISSRPEVLLKVPLSHIIGDRKSTKAEKWRSMGA